VADEKKPEKPKKSWTTLFVRDEEEAPAAAPPVPAPIPGAATRPAVIPMPAPMPVAEVVDQGMVDRILGALLESAPEGYKDFVADLSTLAEALPTEDLLYKAALRLAVSKQGHSVPGLLLDFDKCLRLLEEQDRSFNVDVEEQVKNRVGGRQAEVARLEGEINALREQMAQLQAQRDAEAAAIATDTAKIESAKVKFKGAYQVAYSQLLDQKNKLSLYGGKG